MPSICIILLLIKGLVISTSTLIRRKVPHARPLLAASTKRGTPISLVIPTVEFILLIGILKTRIQKRDCWKVTFSELTSLVKRFNRTNLLSKDHGLLSRISFICSFISKIARNKLFLTSLMVIRWGPLHNCWMVDLKASLLKSLLVCNLNRRLSWACSFDQATSWDLTDKTHFSSSERVNFFQSSSIAASISRWWGIKIGKIVEEKIGRGNPLHNQM